MVERLCSEEVSSPGVALPEDNRPHHTQRLKMYKYKQIKVICSVCIVEARRSSNIGDEPTPSRMLRSSDATILSLPSTKYMSSIPRRYTLSPSSRSAALCYTLSPSVPVATPCLTSPVCGSLLLLIPLLLLRSPSVC